MRSVAGIDPGVRGGIAVLDALGRVLFVKAFTPNMTHEQLVGVVREADAILGVGGGYDFFIEKVGFKRGDGGKGAFTFGQISGLLRGAVLALEASIHNVYPSMWQARLDCLSGGNKNVTKKRARELFPEIKMTHMIADALLIAEYGRRFLAEKGTLHES